MRKYILLAISLFFSNIAHAQTVNNATVNIQGANQNVLITQSGAGHTANLSLSGDSVSVIASQSGITPQSFSLSVTCGVSCPNSPYIINQY
jgi:hypothetical protein